MQFERRRVLGVVYADSEKLFHRLIKISLALEFLSTNAVSFVPVLFSAPHATVSKPDKRAAF